MLDVKEWYPMIDRSRDYCLMKNEWEDFLILFPYCYSSNMVLFKQYLFHQVSFHFSVHKFIDLHSNLCLSANLMF